MGEELTMTAMTESATDVTTPPGGVSDAGPPQVPGRPLWVIFGSLLVLAAVVFGTFNVIDLLAHEERTERFTVPATELDRLLVDNDSGSVTIVGADTDEVSVEAEVSDGLRQTGFRHEVVGSTLELHGSCPLIGSMWCRVTLRVEVPRRVDLEIHADDDSVDVRDVDGEVVVDADNGSVDLSDVSGSIDVETDNGRVSAVDVSSPVAGVSADNGRVELVFSVPPDSVTVGADNGSVEIVVPEVEGGYNVTAEADNGSPEVLVDDNPDSPRTIQVTADNGDITVRAAAN
jgi:Putative adhesin